MNPFILPPAMDKIVGQTELYNQGMVTSLGEGKLWIQTFQTPLKLTVRAERSLNIYKWNEVFLQDKYVSCQFCSF